MSLSRQPHPALPRLLSAILILLGLAACESNRPTPPAPAAAAAEVAIPEMEAQATFLAGQIQAEILLNRGGFSERRGRAGGSGGGSANPAGADSRRDGRGKSGARGSGGALAEGRAGDRDDSPVQRILPTNLPALRLHLRLTNLGATPIDVEVTDFDSELGNFVVQPDKIRLTPNGSAEADPMTSRLGIASDAIPVKVSLRAGGQMETQVLTLQPNKLATPPAPVPSAP